MGATEDGRADGRADADGRCQSWARSEKGPALVGIVVAVGGKGKKSRLSRQEYFLISHSTKGRQRNAKGGDGEAEKLRVMTMLCKRDRVPIH